MLVKHKRSSLLDPIVSCAKNEVLWIRTDSQVTKKIKRCEYGPRNYKTFFGVHLLTYNGLAILQFPNIFIVDKKSEYIYLKNLYGLFTKQLKSFLR